MQAELEITINCKFWHHLGHTKLKSKVRKTPVSLDLLWSQLVVVNTDCEPEAECSVLSLKPQKDTTDPATVSSGKLH